MNTDAKSSVRIDTLQHTQGAQAPILSAFFVPGLLVMVGWRGLFGGPLTLCAVVSTYSACHPMIDTRGGQKAQTHKEGTHHA